MPIGAADLQSAHALFGLPAEVIEQRRTLYRTLLEMLSGEEPRPDADEDILDNPAARGHLGAVHAGDESFTPSKCFPVSELVAEGYTTTVEGLVVRLASTRSAQEALAGAVLKINGELQRYGADVQESALATTIDQAAHSLFDRLVDGIELAVRMAPVLALDLLPHVSLFAVLTRDAAGRLGSASAREFPGLILIPEPETLFEVSEALIHEGAHQKFFDLATTRALFGAHANLAPLFSPSWAQPDAPGWPIEQAFAAWHAYCCLSAFHGSIGDRAIHDGSLLPCAAQRHLEIGEWLLAHGEYLGQDGHALLGAVLGRRPERDSTDVTVDVGRFSLDAADGSLLVRVVGRRVLVARRSGRAELFWIKAEYLSQLSVP